MIEPITDSPVALDLLVQTTFWLALGLAGSLALRRHPARAHTALLVCLIAALLAPPLSLAFRAWGWGLLAPLASSAGGDGAPPPDLAGAGPGGRAELPTWQLVAIAGWLALSGAMVLRLLASLSRSARIIGGARPLDGDHDVIRTARDAAARLRLRGAPEVLVSPHVACPAIWCWGRAPRVILPQAMGERPDSESLPGVLCHELAHFRRRDHLWSLLGELALCALPWHPLLWRARRRLAQLSEQACDTWVVATGESRTAFAQVLLRLAPQRPGTLALAAVTSRRCLGARIAHILNGPDADPHPGRCWRAAVLLAAAVLLPVVALGHRRAVAGPAAPDVVTIDHALRPSPPPLEIGDDEDGTIVVVPAELDLGETAPGTTRSGAIWLVNRSREPMEVLGAKASCGCTTVSGLTPSVLRPGAAMELEIAMVASKTPGESKTKHVTFDVKGQPPIRLPVHLRSLPR